MQRASRQPRRRADHQRQHPDARDQRQHPFERPLLGVVDRIGDRPVAVERDRAQVQDRGGTAQHVRGEPHLAHVDAELPPAEQRVGDVERQDEYGHRQVRHRQRHDEEVLHDPERLVREHAQYDEDVADDRDDDDERQDEGRTDRFPLWHGQIDAEHGRVERVVRFGAAVEQLGQIGPVRTVVRPEQLAIAVQPERCG
uniref:Uncharacterized protein n=1 Tax=Anopheles coluzzii TaxID=1518534 RepID=A0A8W7PTC6_ANOCL